MAFEGDYPLFHDSVTSPKAVIAVLNDVYGTDIKRQTGTSDVLVTRPVYDASTD